MAINTGETLRLIPPQLNLILDANNNIVGIQNNLANGSDFRGGAGSTTWAALTDKAIANLPVDNTALSVALAAKAPLLSPVLTGTPTAPTVAPLANNTQIASTAYADAAVAVVAPNAPITVVAGFTFAKATHANRRIGYNAAGAGNATFDGTAAFTTDDGFRLMQEGAGAVTLLASAVTFSNPKSLPLTTTGAGTYIDAEWDATIGQLVITSVGTLVTLGANIFTGIQTLPASGQAAPAICSTLSSSTGFTINAATQAGITVGGNQRLLCDSGAKVVAVATLGDGLAVKEGANGKQGTVVLVAGTATVANTNVTAVSRIFLTSNLDGGTVGFLRSPSRIAATSFVITSSSGTDTSTVAYQIFEPA